MKNIIVPTDFSDNANNALIYALSIAKRAAAKVTLFHTYHLPPSNSTVMKDISPFLKQDAEENLARIAKQIKNDPEYSNIEFTTVAKKGQLVTELKTVAKEMHTDWIVMGTKGASGASEFFIGTNTVSVIEGTTCPVLAVPENAAYKNISRILYATNYYDTDFDSIKKLIEVAEVFNASIVLLHVASDTHTTEDEASLIDAFAQKVKESIPYPDISYQLVESTDVLNGINSTIQSMNIDLVAMTTRKRNFFEKYFNSSMTKKMAYHSSIPLLAFHT